MTKANYMDEVYVTASVLLTHSAGKKLTHTKPLATIRIRQRNSYGGRLNDKEWAN